jgi:hypothetical protein
MTDNDALISDYLRRLEAAASGLPADRRAELIEEISAHITEATTQSPAEVGARSPNLLDVLGRLGDPEDIVRAASDSPTLALVQAGAPEPGIGASAAPGPESAWLGGQGAGTSPPPYPPTTNWPGPAGPADAGPHGTTPLGPPYPRGDHRRADYGPAGPAPAASAPRQARPGGLEIAAVALALGSILLVPFLGLASLVVWLVGIVLLWYSARWRVSDKVLGTVVLPVGIGLFVAVRRLARATGGGQPPRMWLGGSFPVVRIFELVVILAAAVIIAVRLLRQASSAS